MNTAENFIILQGHVYQHNKKKSYLTIGLFKPTKLKNSRYFFNTPRMYINKKYRTYNQNVLHLEFENKVSVEKPSIIR